MTAAVLVLAVVAAHLSALGRSWAGDWSPEPLVPLAALLALGAPRRLLPFAALLLGGLRAVVLLEPAGGQVLSAWLALTVVSALRERLGARALLRGSLLVACTWWALGALLARVASPAPRVGPELLLGAALVAPLPLLASLRRQRAPATP